MGAILQMTDGYTSRCGAVSSVSFIISVAGGGLINGVTYLISAQHSGKSMDVNGTSTSAGAIFYNGQPVGLSISNRWLRTWEWIL